MTPQMHGRYPDYDVLEQTRALGPGDPRVCSSRVERRPADPVLRPRRGSDAAARSATSSPAQDAEPRIPVLEMVDAKLYDGRLDGYRYDDMPDDTETWRLVARGPRRGRRGPGAPTRSPPRRRAARRDRAPIRRRRARGRRLGATIVAREGMERRHARRAVASSTPIPWAWNEIGYGGPAYPRGYMRLAIGRARALRGARRSERGSGPDVRRRGLRVKQPRTLLKGGLGPTDNDSRVPARPHAGADPGPRPRWPRYRDDDEVDLVIVGAGAGGSTLAQRLARRGWRIVIARVGPVLGSRPRLGLRRGRLPQALLDRAPRDRRRGPGRARQEQLRPRGRRLDGPLRRLHAALSSLRLRGPQRATASAPTGRSPTGI